MEIEWYMKPHPHQAFPCYTPDHGNFVGAHAKTAKFQSLYAPPFLFMFSNNCRQFFISSDYISFQSKPRHRSWKPKSTNFFWIYELDMMSRPITSIIFYEHHWCGEFQHFILASTEGIANRGVLADYFCVLSAPPRFWFQQCLIEFASLLFEVAPGDQNYVRARWLGESISDHKSPVQYFSISKPALLYSY